MKINAIFILFSILISSKSFLIAQQKENSDSIWISSFYRTALTQGESYENLRSLCKDVGARISGSAAAQMAVEWSKQKMDSYGFDRVYLQPVYVPHWVRGTKENGWIRTKNDKLIKLKLLALGGSVGTNGLLEGQLIVFNKLEDLKNAKSSTVKGKVVFINQPMDAAQINTFNAYGGCYPIRGDGAVEAARLGAKAVIIRSLAMSVDPHPHTGSMHYEDGIEKIPAAAVSTEDAEQIVQLAKTGDTELILEMDCALLPDVLSYNVITELKGKNHPERIITMGGHLDSWDTGEGAHDDGAGAIHCLEALRMLKQENYRPNNTIRVVFFMNEENGNRGGMAYADSCKNAGEIHLAALESDRGGFVPRGFQCDGTTEQIQFLQQLSVNFTPYELSEFKKGYGGVDISPLKKAFPGIPLFGFVPDSQRYFDVHHAPSDIFENVNKRELELGCAAIASFIYLLDQKL